MDAQQEDHARLIAFQCLLDGSRIALEQTVDLASLRKLCSRGIPDHPPHLRPLAYSLLLQCLPTEKQAWRSTERQQRQRYYTLVQTLMDELEPSDEDLLSSTCSHDQLLLNITKDVQRIAAQSSFWRGRTSTARSSPLHPPTMETDLRIRPDLSESSSSDDEQESYIPRRRTEPLLSRRALFSRRDALAEAEHRRNSSTAHTSSISSSSRSTTQSHNRTDEDISSSSSFPVSPEVGTMLSPKITLSVEPTLPSTASILSRLDAKRFSPINTTESPIGLTSPDADASLFKPPSPITLLSPKPIPRSGSAYSPSSPISGSLYHPDTHSESLSRLIYIFCRANPHRTWQSAFADIAGVLYTVFAGVDAGATLDQRRRGKRSSVPTAQLSYVEERTFWCLTAFISEMDGLWEDALSASAFTVTLQKLERRLHWADSELYTFLKSNQLDPSGPLYTYRWLLHLFTRDLPSSSTPFLWDFILSENLATPDTQPRVDAAVDVAIAMLLLAKDQLMHPRARQRGGPPSPQSPANGLWGEIDSVEDLAPKAEANCDEIFMNGLNLLRSYPIKLVGRKEDILEIALEVRDARTIAITDGKDPDQKPVPTPEASGSSILSMLGGLVVSSESALADASTKWAATASKLVEVSQTATPDGSNSTWGSLGKSAGKLWQSSWVGKSNASDSAQNTAATYPTTPPRAVGGTRRFPSSLSRECSDTMSSVSSLQERIASLTSPFSTQKTPPNPGHSKSSSLQSASGSGPRPLLLSGSARRVSAGNGIGGPHRRGSLPTRSTAGSPTPTLSPPTDDRSPLADSQSPSPRPTSGLYRISSRQSYPARLPSSLSESPAIGRNLDYGEE